MGSDSDLEIMNEAAKALDLFDIPYEIDICSAHRSPARTSEFSRQAASRGIRVIIAGAGGAAHLAGVIAAETILPVIAVPIAATSLGGLDALLAMVQMPAGIPVATVAIGKVRSHQRRNPRRPDPRHQRPRLATKLIARTRKDSLVAWKKNRASCRKAAHEMNTENAVPLLSDVRMQRHATRADLQLVSSLILIECET